LCGKSETLSFHRNRISPKSPQPPSAPSPEIHRAVAATP
jgi:hypothetical protein